VIVQAPPPPVDAAPPPIDAPQTVVVHVESKPEGAMIIDEDEGIDRCEATPCEMKLVLGDHTVHLRAQLQGYDDHTFVVNPAKARTEGLRDLRFSLVKAVGRAPKTHPVHHVTPRPPTNPTGGELTGPPPSSGGTVPAP
jgi:hypothetical protein